MAVSSDYLDHLLDQFAAFGAVEVRRMFGGVGLFRGGLMIALVTGDTLYFKTDEGSRGAFEAAGMTPFSFDRRGRRMVTSYYEAPAEVFDDAEALARWARGAHEAARRVDRARAKPKKRGAARPKRAKATLTRAKTKPKSAKSAARPKAGGARAQKRRPAAHR
jgi:DNA transformation protein